MADFDTLTLTTNHAASSYGQPVLVIDGAAYGPADMTPAGVTGAELVATWAARFTGPHYSDFATVLSQLGQLEAGDRVIVLYLVKRLLEVQTAKQADWQDPKDNPFLLSGAEIDDYLTKRRAR